MSVYTEDFYRALVDTPPAKPKWVNPYKNNGQTLPPPDPRGELSTVGKSLRAFVDETQAAAGGVVDFAGAALGKVSPAPVKPYTDALTNWGKEVYERNTAEAVAGSQAPTSAAMQNMDEIKSVSDLGDWAAYQLPKGLANLGTMYLPGWGLAKKATQTAKATIKATAAAEAAKVAAKSKFGEAATKAAIDTAEKAALGTKAAQMQIGAAQAKAFGRGGAIGTLGFEGGLAMGEMTTGKDAVAPEDALLPALGVGALNGAIEMAEFGMVAKYLGFGTDVIKKGVIQKIKEAPDLSKKVVELVKGVGKGAALGVPVEGGQEALQELVTIAGDRWAKDEDIFGKLSEEDWSRIRNSAAAGALVGGTAGAVLGPFQGSAAPNDLTPEQNQKTIADAARMGARFGGESIQQDADLAQQAAAQQAAQQSQKAAEAAAKAKEAVINITIPGAEFPNLQTELPGPTNEGLIGNQTFIPGERGPIPEARRIEEQGDIIEGEVVRPELPGQRRLPGPGPQMGAGEEVPPGPGPQPQSPGLPLLQGPTPENVLLDEPGTNRNIQPTELPPEPPVPAVPPAPPAPMAPPAAAAEPIPEPVAEPTVEPAPEPLPLIFSDRGEPFNGKSQATAFRNRKGIKGEVVPYGENQFAIQPNEPWTRRLDEVELNPNEIIRIEEDPRIQDPEIMQRVRDLATQIAGWQETGGRLIRDEEGNPVNRTVWVPKDERWLDRPKDVKPEHIRNGLAKIEKILEQGQPIALPARERRAVTWLFDQAATDANSPVWGDGFDAEQNTSPTQPDGYGLDTTGAEEAGRQSPAFEGGQGVPVSGQAPVSEETRRIMALPQEEFSNELTKFVNEDLSRDEQISPADVNEMVGLLDNFNSTQDPAIREQADGWIGAMEQAYGEPVVTTLLNEYNRYRETPYAKTTVPAEGQGPVNAPVPANAPANATGPGQTYPETGASSDATEGQGSPGTPGALGQTVPTDLGTSIKIPEKIETLDDIADFTTARYAQRKDKLKDDQGRELVSSKAGWHAPAGGWTDSNGRIYAPGEFVSVEENAGKEEAVRFNVHPDDIEAVKQKFPQAQIKELTDKQGNGLGKYQATTFMSPSDARQLRQMLPATAATRSIMTKEEADAAGVKLGNTWTMGSIARLFNKTTGFSVAKLQEEIKRSNPDMPVKQAKEMALAEAVKWLQTDGESVNFTPYRGIPGIRADMEGKEVGYSYTEPPMLRFRESANTQATQPEVLESRPGSVIDSTGVPVHSTPEGQANFQQWFGQSKAVDEAGRPLRLYRGTVNKGETTLSESFEAGGGIFITDSQEVADIFRYPREFGEVVTEVYDEEADDYVPVEPGDLQELYANVNNPLVLTGQDAQDFVYDSARQARDIRAARQQGYDSIVLQNVQEGVGEWMAEGSTYILFDAGQAKSATANKGTFNTANKSIYESSTDKQKSEKAAAPTKTRVVSRAEFEADVAKYLPKDFIARAEKAGILIVNETSPEGAPSGTFNTRTGVMTVNLDKMPVDDTPAGVLLHEGKHRSLREMLGDAQHTKLFNDLRALAARGDAVAQRAVARGAQFKDEWTNHEEALAYYTQHVTKPTGLWRRIINAIKAWWVGSQWNQSLKAKGLDFKLTDELAVALVVRAMKQDKRGMGQQVAAVELPPTISIDGIERSTTDSTGKPIQSTEEGVRNFWKWFGNSTLIDAQGRPQVVYHGTRDSIDAFDLEHPNRKDNGWLGKGVYITDELRLAKAYANLKRGAEDPTVLSLYARLENPYNATVDEKRMLSSASVADIERWTEHLRSKNHDGVILTFNDGTREILVFKPTQVKSATDNQGTFGENDAGIYRSDVLESRVLDAINPFTMPERMRAYIFDPADSNLSLSRFERIRQYVQDRFLQMKKKQEGVGGQLPPSQQVYETEAASHGRKKDRVRELQMKYLDPMLRLAAKNGWDLEKDVGELAYARAALESNERLRLRSAKHFLNELAKAVPAYPARKLKEDWKAMKDLLKNDPVFQAMSPQMRKRTIQQNTYNMLKQAVQDMQQRYPSKELTEFVEAFGAIDRQPTGMTDTDAQHIMTRWQGRADWADMQQLLDLFDQMNRGSITAYVQSGMMTQEMAAQWMGAYQHYATLHREGYERETGGPGMGFSPAKPSKLRFYSAKRAVNVFSNTVMNAIRAQELAENNRVMQTLHNFILAHPDEDFWEVKGKAQVAYLDDDGFVQFGASKAINPSHQALVYIKGRMKLIEAKSDNEAALSIIKALNNLSTPRLGPIMQLMMKANRFMASMNTSLSPEFFFVNPIRDLLTAQFNWSDGEADQYRKQMLKDIPAAIKSLNKVFAQRRRNEPLDMNDPWTQWVRAFEQSGATTGWLDVFETAQDQKEALEKRMKQLAPGMNWHKSLHEIGQWIEDHNAVMENAVRLVTFKALVRDINQPAVPLLRAANVAKDLTVNFNRRGTAGPAINALWMFAGAGIQGSARIIMALKNRKVQKMVGAAVVVSILVDQLNRMLDDDDEYDKIPEHVKQRNLVFKNLTGVGPSYFTVPAPWGYNLFWYIGQKLSEGIAVQGGYGPKGWSPAKAGWDIALTGYNAFMPVQGGTVAQALSPTVFDPIFQIAENKDAFGRQLRPEPFPGEVKPRTEQYWGNASDFSVAAAKLIGAMTGGDDVTAGGIDLSPEWLDAIGEQALGSVGRQLKDFGWDFTLAPALGLKEFEPEQLPVIRKFTAFPTSGQETAVYHDRVAQVMDAQRRMSAYTEGARRNPEEARALRQESGELLRMADYTKDVEKQLKSIRQRMRLAESRGDSAGTKMLKDRMDLLRKRYNETFERRVGG